MREPVRFKLSPLFALVAALSVVLTVGCSKQSGPERPPHISVNATNDFDLGVVEVSDRVPKQIDLGSGTKCLINPSLLADGELLLELVVSRTDGEGKTQILCRPRIQTRSGIECAVANGTLDSVIRVRLVPQLKK